MMFNIPWSMCCLLVLAAVWSPAAETPSAAILPLRSELIAGGETGTVQVVSDIFAMTLDEAGIVLVERQRIEAVLAEQARIASGALDSGAAVRLGRLLQADYLIVGTLRGGSDGRLLQLRAIRIADGAVAWAGEAQGDAGALISQAPGLAAAAASRLEAATDATFDADQRPLAALRHHERAQALRGQGAPAAAAAEELLALRHEPGNDEAELGFVEALVAADHNALAAAEAAALLRRRPDHPQQARLHALARDAGIAPIAFAPTRPLPRPATTPDPVDDQRELIAMLEQVQRSGGKLAGIASIDLATAWTDLAHHHGQRNRDRAALEAYREALRQLWSLRLHDPDALYRPLTTLSSNSVGKGAAGDPRSRPIQLLLSAWRSRRNNRPTVPNDMAAAVRACRRAGGLPDGFDRPQPVRRIEVPITERAQIGETLLVRPDWSAVPPRSPLLFANARTGQSYLVSTMRPIVQAWKAEEADAVYARAGAPWIPQQASGGTVAGGRSLALGAGGDAPDALRQDLRLGADSHGLSVQVSSDRDFRQLVITVAVTDPAAPEAEWAGASLLEQAVFDLLEGRGEEAEHRLQLIIELGYAGATNEIGPLLSIAREVR